MNTPHTLTPDLLRSTYASDLSPAEKLDSLVNRISDAVPFWVRRSRVGDLMREVGRGLILTDNDGSPTGEFADDEQTARWIDGNVHHANWALESHVRVSPDRLVAARYSVGVTAWKGNQ